MIRTTDRARSGITLTEILISIMIMGVGMISLATLFPMGLLRLREAQRSSRSSYLTQSAAADLEARNLLGKTSFLDPYLSPWNNLSPNGAQTYTMAAYDPWVQDTGSHALTASANPSLGAYRGVSSFGAGVVVPGPGLPVAYDPLWRYQTGIYIGDARTEGRFGSGFGFIRNDPSGGPPSAHGLQRLTNFNPLVTYPNTPAAFPQNTVPDIFVSPEDIVLQSDTGSQGASNASPIVPDMSAGSPVTDWRFTWMFTGQQTDSLNGTVFDGDVVIWENRPFGINQVNNQWVVEGETVVEGVFGLGTRVVPLVTGGSVGFAKAAERTVLLRWQTTVPDPEVKVGGWIADVTYERDLSTQNARFNYPDFPYQRCYWYQIVKRTQPAPHAFTSDPGGVSFRAMSVWVSTPLKAQTLLNTSSGEPAHVNAALIAPNVVNVFPRVIYTR